MRALCQIVLAGFTGIAFLPLLRGSIRLN